MKAFFKKSLAALLSAMLLLAAVPFAATAAEVAPQEQSVGASSGTTGDCTWTLNNGTLTISGNGAMGDYSFIYSDGTFITTAPWGANIKAVIIEDGVTNIGSYVFYGCTGLTSITIPDSMTSIGESAFDGCTGLTSVHISDIAAWCNIAFPSDYSNPLNYAHNLYLNDMLITDLVIPDSVTSIGSYAFYGCTGLTSVTIPDSVTSIGVNALGYYFNSYSILKISNFTIMGKKGSEAERYANNNGFTFIERKQAVIGDVDSDGKINVSDLTMIQRHLAGFEILTGERLDLADTNGDGKVTIDDATLLQMFLAEYDVQLG